MTFKEYLTGALTTATFDARWAIKYPQLGIIGEAGEVADKVKKVIRDHSALMDIDPHEWTEEIKRGIALELGDVCWYTAIIANTEELDINQIEAETQTFNSNNHQSINIVDCTLLLARSVNRLSYLFGITSHTEEFKYSMLWNAIEVFSIAQAIAVKLGYNTLQDVWQMNLDKLKSRQQRGKIAGSGDNR